MKEQILRPGAELKLDTNAPFKIMRDCILALFGESYLNRILDINRTAFASQGIFAWRPNDANIVMDVTPMPEPWVGQWGYRLRFCSYDSTGDICINQFFVPARNLPGLKAGSLDAMN